ncbi:four helix bundle protein [bacterium]|jgi:four helix bundle protein|nr:four helix bundle protein [bacterium]
MLQNFRSYQLAVQLYKDCKPIKAQSHIKDQLSRATLSVVLNLAEGSAKPTPKERKRYYSIALASLRETQAILTILEQQKEFTVSNDLGAMLYKLVHSK